MTDRHIAAFGLVALLAAGSVAAQPAPGREARDEAFKIIDAYVISNLQESVGLTDDQYLKLLPLVKKLQDERRGYAQRRMRTLLELRQGFRAGTLSEARVGELLKELKDVESQEGPALKRHRDAIDGTLSTVQQAKFRVMEMEVEHRIRQVMARAREDAPGRRPRP